MVFFINYTELQLFNCNVKSFFENPTFYPQFFLCRIDIAFLPHADRTRRFITFWITKGNRKKNPPLPLRPLRPCSKTRLSLDFTTGLATRKEYQITTSLQLYYQLKYSTIVKYFTLSELLSNPVSSNRSSNLISCK